MLSAALTFGLYIVGHFNADLRNFEQVVDSPAGGVAGARAVPRRCPNLSAVRRQDAGRPRPAGRGRLHAPDGRLRRSPTSRRCSLGVDARSSRGGTSSDGAPAAAAWRSALAVVALAAGRRAADRRAIASYPRGERVDRAAALRRARARPCSRLALVVRRARRRRLLDPRAFSTTAATACAHDRRQRVRAAVSAARPDDHAGSVLQHRLPVRRDLPERAAARRARPPRSGDRAAREGHRRAAEQVAVPPRHRLRPLLAAARLPAGGAEWFQRAAAAAGRAELARAARRDDAERGDDRSSARLSVAADSAVRRTTGCAEPPSAACCSSTRSISSTSCRRWSNRGRRASRDAASRGSIWCAAACSAASRSIRPARRTCSTRDTARVTLAPESPLIPHARPARRR